MQLELGSLDLATKNRQRVLEHEDLRLVRPLTTRKQHNQFEQAADDHVEGRHKQRRPPTDGEPTLLRA
jgi:hypothetical protein